MKLSENNICKLIRKNRPIIEDTYTEKDSGLLTIK